MSSYATADECDDYLERRLLRVPDFEMNVCNPEVVDRLKKAVLHGGTVSVAMRQWHGKAYVLSLKEVAKIGNSVEYRARLQPTGRSTSRAGAITSGDFVKVCPPFRFYGAGIIAKAIEESKDRLKLDVDKMLLGLISKKYDSVNRKEGTVAPKNGKIPRFYVGSKTVFNPRHNETEPWAKHTEAEAIAHAKALLEKNGEEQYIVKIIKVVRRKPMPIVVEAVS